MTRREPPLFLSIDSFQRHPRRSRAFEATLWTIATVCLALAVGIQADAWIYQHHARPPSASSVPSRDAGQSRPRAEPVAAGTPIARLSIPRIGLDVVVAEGSSSTVLRRAVGRLTGSARPGETGNIVLAGHRDMFFRPLAHIRTGDEIFLESDAGKQIYRVEWTRVVEPTEVGVLEQGSESVLTLITCYPFQFVGSAPRRFIVRARERMS